MNTIILYSKIKMLYIYIFILIEYYHHNLLYLSNLLSLVLQALVLVFSFITKSIGTSMLR